MPSGSDPRSPRHVDILEGETDRALHSPDERYIASVFATLAVTVARALFELSYLIGTKQGLIGVFGAVQLVI